MDRREALRRTALVIGGIVSAPTIVGIMNGCTAKPTINWTPLFLSPDQGILISELTEIIIPKTDTPGAKDVGVPGFIDVMLKDVYEKKDQDIFLAGLKAFDDDVKKTTGDAFLELDPEERTEYVHALHAKALKNKIGKGEEKPFILKVKELTVAGYFTSEAGAAQVLQYEAVPGAYHGCLPLAEAGNGKTWATG